MQAKRSTKILSALSMAAVSVIGAKVAHAQATLNLYYGQDSSFFNSNNGIIIGTGYNPAGANTKNNGTGVATHSDVTGALKYITSPTEVTVSQTATTTITLPVGDYLSLAIDALLSGNSNPDGGKVTGASATQPSFLGLSELSLGVSSTDATAAILTPISTSAPLSTFNSQNTYNSTTSLNSSIPSGSGAPTAHIGPNSASSPAYQVVPAWGSLSSADGRADVQPNEPGFDPGHGNGNVGLNGFTTGGNSAVNAGTPAGTQVLEQFTTSNNTTGYNSATDYYDSLVYQGLTAGTVTLSPNIKLSGSSYWTLAASGTAPTINPPGGTHPSSSTTTPGKATTYQTHTMTQADNVSQAPMLVIVVTGGVTSTTAPVSHAIVALAATANTNYGTTITNGTGASQGTFTPPSANTLTLTGGSGKYNIAQVTGISTNAGAAIGNVNVSGWNPASDPEIFGVDVKVNGTNATPSQLATLIAAIGGSGVPASSGVAASTVDPTGVLAALDTPTTSYNLFLTFAAGGPGAADNLNLDLSTANDAALSGYTFSAVSVVPEPVSLGVLALGGLGLMSRRTRRKS